ncbi:MAG: hypothetical protein MMC33_009095 [Icmadophila ericetorum]|nr:hypothetical protein [Icmadophila ericetorum]
MSREGQPDAVIEALLEQLRNRPSTHMVELNGLLRGLLRIADQLDQTSQAPILKFVIDLLLQAGITTASPITNDGDSDMPNGSRAGERLQQPGGSMQVAHTNLIEPFDRISHIDDLQQSPPPPSSHPRPPSWHLFGRSSQSTDSTNTNQVSHASQRPRATAPSPRTDSQSHFLHSNSLIGQELKSAKEKQQTDVRNSLIDSSCAGPTASDTKESPRPIIHLPRSDARLLGQPVPTEMKIKIEDKSEDDEQFLGPITQRKRMAQEDVGGIAKRARPTEQYHRLYKEPARLRRFDIDLVKNAPMAAIYLVENNDNGEKLRVRFFSRSTGEPILQETRDVVYERTVKDNMICLTRGGREKLWEAEPLMAETKAHLYNVLRKHHTVLSAVSVLPASASGS